FRYFLIRQFEQDEEKIWCICISLFLQGEPSFLFLSFMTQKKELVEFYKRGSRVQWVLKEHEGASSQYDGLAQPWTELETLRAEMIQHRRLDDIPSEDLELYEECSEEPLKAPN